jgi:hypothetical protein
MTLAMKRLQNIGWLALVFCVAIMLYPLSMNVASVHSDLVNADNRIKETKREISFLQAELRTRASMQQLQEWNTVLYGYQPPTAQQFLNGESALASLNGVGPISKPVMVSVSSPDGAKPAGVIGSPFAKLASAVMQNDGEVDSVDDGYRRDIGSNPAGKTEKSASSQLSAATTRTEKLASIDQKLLSDDLLKDLQKKSDAERKRR